MGREMNAQQSDASCVQMQAIAASESLLSQVIHHILTVRLPDSTVMRHPATIA